MELARMRIVALLLYSLAITKLSFVGCIPPPPPPPPAPVGPPPAPVGPPPAPVGPPQTTSNGMCEGDWSYSYGSCYSPEQETSKNITAAQQHCKDMDKDSHLAVLNTREEAVAGIENGVFEDGEWVCQGMITDNNGTTWTKLDGSNQETYIVTLRPFYDYSEGIAAKVCCYIYEAPNSDYCYVYDDEERDYFFCEKPGPYMNSGPCDIKIHRKLRKDATRKISFKNTKRDMCYIELWRSHFRPAQIKIYGYKFASTASTCSQGFFVQNNGEVLDYLLLDKLTCGNNDGPNGPLIRKRSERGGKIRLYIAMNGDGRRVWLRAKGRSFRY